MTPVPPTILDPHHADIFREFFDIVQGAVHQIAVQHGWWEEDRNNGEMIALMHSELSEALEALRHGNPPSDHIPQFSGVEEELADVIIRICDIAYKRGWNVSGAIIEKMGFNSAREFKHGGKAF